jgi:hypothetical protein
VGNPNETSNEQSAGKAGASSNERPARKSNATRDRHAIAEDKLLHLEAMIKLLMQNQSSEPSQSNGVAPPVPPEGLTEDGLEPPATAVEQPHNQGVEGMTFPYVGSTHWSAILDDIDELKAVLGASGSGSGTMVEENESAISETPTSRTEIIFGSSDHYSLQKIISQYLPSKQDMDRLLSIYFQGEIFILPFIHTYQFQRQYQEFCVDPAGINPLWLSMLFSVCYMASLIGSATGSCPLTQSGKAHVRSSLHTAAGQCLVVGEYHRPQKFSLEALAMYAHCKASSNLDPTREVGAILAMVVRMAYEMGYHRDPDFFGSFSVFDGEMRRRFWAVCRQMDAMISFQHGLPSNICLEDCDTKSPINLLDSDFDVDSEVLPASRSENEATRLLWFIV